MNASEQRELEKDKWINISDATPETEDGSIYDFVDVSSILRTEEEEIIFTIFINSVACSGAPAGKIGRLDLFGFFVFPGRVFDF